MAKDLSDFPPSFDPEAYRQKAEALGEQVAEYVNRGYANALRKSNIHVVRAFQEQYTAIGYQLKFGIINQEEYFEKLATIRDRFFSKNTQEWYKYTMEIYDYYNTAVQQHLDALVQYGEDCTDRFSDIADNAKSAVSSIAEAKDAFAEKLYRSVGSGVGYDTKVTKIHNYYPTGDTLVLTDYSLSKLEKEIETLRAFDETLQKLQERADALGAESFRAFFEELRTLSVEDASRLAQLLLSENDESFLSYLSAYGEKKSLVASITDGLYQEDFTKAAAEIRTEIETAFSQIPEDFFSYGELTAENFKAGFTAEILSLFSEVEQLLGVSLSPDLTHHTETNTFAPTYNLYNYGETTAQQLMSARNFSILEALRQGASK